MRYTSASKPVRVSITLNADKTEIQCRLLAWLVFSLRLKLAGDRQGLVKIFLGISGEVADTAFLLINLV